MARVLQVALISACGICPQVAIAAEEKIILHPSEIMILERGLLAEEIPVSGVAKAEESAVVSARVTSVARHVLLRPGERVEAGAVLAELDRTDLELQVRLRRSEAQAARVALALAEQELARQRSLQEKGHSSKASLESATSEVARLGHAADDADMQLEAAELDLSRTTIVAPISGFISERLIEPGQLVQSGSEIFRIVDPSKMVVEVRVPFSDSVDIRQGMHAKLFVPRAASTDFDAIVERINPELSDASRAATLYLKLSNEHGSLRSGTFLTGSIIIRERENAISVPATSIVEDAGTAVMAIKEGVVTSLDVETGDAWSKGRLVEITGGLTEGMTILIAPLSGIDAGDAVEISG